LKVNLWGAIVYAIGAYLSDKFKARFWVLVICCPFGIAGYAILLAWDVPIGKSHWSAVSSVLFLPLRKRTTS
jgi:hypothetical protein